MKNDSPLRIFSKDQLDSFDQNMIKRHKNELLAQFKLRGKATIVVDGMELNKKDIQEIFDELEQYFPTYQFIIQNKSLYAFLEDGNYGFLQNQTAIQHLKNFNADKGKLDEKIIGHLQSVIPQLIKSPNVKNHTRLKTIKHFISHYNPLLMDSVYSNSFHQIENHLSFIEKNFKTPFLDENYDSYHPTLKRHVNLEYYECFEFLPDSFKELASQYSKWCNDVIVKKSLEVHDDITKLSRDSLYTLKNAASIAAKELDTKENNQIIYLIKRHFDKRARNYTKLSTGALIVLTILYVSRLIFSVERWANPAPQKDPYTYNRKAKVEPEHVKKTKEEARKKLAIQKQDIIDNPVRISEYDILEYGGEKQMAINAKLTREKEREEYTEQWYDISVHPSKSTVFKFIISPELYEKHSGKIWPVVMNFKHPQVKNSTLQHKVFFDFNKEKRIYPQKYILKKSDSDQPLTISLKPIPLENYPLNGVISRVDSEDGKVLYSSKFQINFDDENEIYNVTLGRSKKKLTFTQEYITQMDPKFAIEEYDKFAIAIKNTNLILNKSLEQGKAHPIQNVLAYTFEEFNETRFQSRKLVSERAYLKYYITSAQDSTAYVELNGQYVNLKYFADCKSGIIKGMTMVNSSDSSLGMETMTIFGKK